MAAESHEVPSLACLAPGAFTRTIIPTNLPRSRLRHASHGQPRVVAPVDPARITGAATAWRGTAPQGQDPGEKGRSHLAQRQALVAPIAQFEGTRNGQKLLEYRV